MEGLTVGSVVTSKNSRSRHSKKRSRSDSNLMQSCTTLSSTHKARLDMRMAEINLEKAKREQALIAKADAVRVKAKSDQRAQEALLESERAIIQAETDLAKAKIRSEASQGLLDLENGEAPLSGQDKVNYYVNNLPLPADI